MSAAEVTSLYRQHAFDPALTWFDMPSVHVPFDVLTHTERCEAQLGSALAAGGRVAVVGVSGSGKSSVLASVLSRAAVPVGMAPIRVPVSLGGGGAATDPVDFARAVLNAVADHVPRRRESQARKVVTDAAGGRRETARRVGVRPQVWGLSVELSGEVRQMMELTERPDQMMMRVREVLELVRSELVPVLVLDDTDKWISPGGQDQAARTRFFSQVIRVIAEEFGCAAAVAVHERYLDEPSFGEARGFLEQHVQVPEVPDVAGVRRILGRRISAALRTSIEPEAVVCDRLVTQGASALLHDYYRQVGDGSLRGSLLSVAELSLVRACDAAADTIGIDHVETAVSEIDSRGAW